MMGLCGPRLETRPLELSVHSTAMSVCSSHARCYAIGRLSISPIVRVSIDDGKVGRLLTVEGVNLASSHARTHSEVTES